MGRERKDKKSLFPESQQNPICFLFSILISRVIRRKNSAEREEDGISRSIAVVLVHRQSVSHRVNGLEYLVPTGGALGRL